MSSAASSDPLVPANTPFNYNVGINYDSWEDGRTGYSITADLQQVTQNFKLIRTYHGAAVGTADPSVPCMDPTQQQVIDYIKSTSDVQLVMGTNNSALAQLNASGDWTAGLMNGKDYTDQWVEMLIDSFGSTSAVKEHLTVILLGNEIDQNGPPPGNDKFDDYYQTWIPNAFDNLKASLNDQGLGDIPVSTTIANYGSTNVVSVQVPAYIADHWPARWNNDSPFVLFNQYTQNSGQSTDFSQVESYFESVQSQLAGTLEVFVGETGYSSYYGASNQAKVYQEIFDWLDGMKSDGKTVPLFVFDAFDRPSFTPPYEVDYGIYGENSSSQPTGLKSDLVGVIPSWTSTPINAQTSSADAYHGDDSDEAFSGASGNDLLFGGNGSDTLRGAANDDILMGGDGNDTLLGGDGDDVAHGGYWRDFIGGGSGQDRLDGGAAADSITGGHGKDELVGGHGSDDLRGGEDDDLLFGGSAADALRGGGGQDLLSGGDGDDFINGGSGSDRAYGGADDDTFVIETLGDLVVEFEGQGIDQVRIADLSAYTLGPNIEEGVLLSDAGDALLRGNSLDNLLLGNEYDNVLLGMAGDDFLKGRDGDDTLNGGGGSNRLRGGSGEDLMRLQRSDRVWGGSGADTFLFNDDEGVSGKLVFEDFVGRNQAAPGGADSLVFATGLESGSFSYIGGAAFSAGGNSEARFAGGERLEIDNDGDGAADMAATVRGLTGPNQLTATDFVWL